MKQTLKAMDFAIFTFAVSSGIHDAMVISRRPLSRSGAYSIPVRQPIIEPLPNGRMRSA